MPGHVWDVTKCARSWARAGWAKSICAGHGTRSHGGDKDPLSLIINAEVGSNYFYSRQYDKAIDQLRRTLELDPNFYYARWNLGMCYAMKGSYNEALNEYEAAYKVSNDSMILGLMGNAYVHLNRCPEASKMLDKLKGLSDVDPYAFVVIYEALGDNEQALQWIEKAYQARSGEMSFIKIDPMLDPLRSDARVADYVKWVGLAN